MRIQISKRLIHPDRGMMRVLQFSEATRYGRAAQFPWKSARSDPLLTSERYTFHLRPGHAQERAHLGRSQEARPRDARERRELAVLRYSVS